MVQNTLADSLFTMAVCEYVRSTKHPRGLLAAMTDTRLSVAAVAERLGYGSEAEFRRFFKRLEGIGPSKACNCSGDASG